MRLLNALRAMLIRSSRAFVWSATALGLLVLLSVFAAIGYDSYRGTLQINEQAAMNIAALAEQDVAHSIELYDLSLQAVLEGMSDADVMRLEPRLRQKALFDTSATAQGLGALVVLDESGSIVVDSRSVIPRPGNFADREYFIVHRDSPHNIGLYVSRPFRARLQGDIWSISISRRVDRADGGFGGIVSGTMKLLHFQRMFSQVALGLNGTITLLRDDGSIIASDVADDERIGSNWQAASAFARLPGGQRGTFTSDESVDGIARLYAFQRVAGLPLVVMVGLSKSQVLAPWWSKILLLGAIFATMAASVIFLVWILETELSRRAGAELAAAELARTDGLTKLANRRWFDEVLAQEWARAARDERPISLVMIDADHFKLFNDTYGHPSGDSALTAIAGVIAGATKRPSDLAVRYGGEEFALLLPDTNERGAMRIAIAIRDGVNGRRIDHAASEHKIVTVSAGVATVVPRLGMRPSSLLRDADAALYRAKERGRNAISAGNVVAAAFKPQVIRAS